MMSSPVFFFKILVLCVSLECWLRCYGCFRMCLQAHIENALVVLYVLASTYNIHDDDAAAADDDDVDDDGNHANKHNNNSNNNNNISIINNLSSLINSFFRFSLECWLRCSRSCAPISTRGGCISKFHELLFGALQGARTDPFMNICYIMRIYLPIYLLINSPIYLLINSSIYRPINSGRLARRPKGAREIC